MAIVDGGMVGPVMEGSGGGWRCKVRHYKKFGPAAYVIIVAESRGCQIYISQEKVGLIPPCYTYNFYLISPFL